MRATALLFATNATDEPSFASRRAEIPAVARAYRDCRRRSKDACATTNAGRALRSSRRARRCCSTPWLSGKVLSGRV